MIRALSLFAALALTLPTQAVALSCARPDVAQTFLKADEANDIYVVLLGTVDYDTARLPARDGRPAEAIDLPARLQARAITRTGFSAWIDRDITLAVDCISAWCGAVPKGRQMLMFLRKTDGSFTLDAGPCPQFFFPDPKGTDIAKVRECLSGGPCKPRFR